MDSLTFCMYGVLLQLRVYTRILLRGAGPVRAAEPRTQQKSRLSLFRWGASTPIVGLQQCEYQVGIRRLRGAVGHRGTTYSISTPHALLPTRNATAMARSEMTEQKSCSQSQNNGVGWDCIRRSSRTADEEDHMKREKNDAAPYIRCRERGRHAPRTRGRN